MVMLDFAGDGIWNSEEKGLLWEIIGEYFGKDSFLFQ